VSGTDTGRPLRAASGWRLPVLIAAGAAYALAAAATTPFTWPADVMTGAPVVALGALAVAGWPLHPRPQPLAGGPRTAVPWLVLLAAVVAWELANYLAAGARSSHPTLSSMSDALDAHYASKALVFFGWLCLGALVVCDGTRRES
jgi:hypothetical protein